jgi:hypothetical protein
MYLQKENIAERNKTIKFTGPCTIYNMEDSIRNFNNEDNGPLLFDMRDITYIEVSSMVFLIAYIDKKHSEGEKIKIELPQKLEIRNFIRRFRLPTVLFSLTGVKFQNLVTTESLKYFGENPNLKGDYRSFQQKKYSSYDSFADAIAEENIHTYSELYQFKTDNDKSTAYGKLLTDWNCAAMQAFLKKYLRSQESDKERLVPNRIIYECITNSQRHSEADKLMVSFIVMYDKIFHISFWDNGVSIIKTLKDVIGRKGLIRDDEIFKDSKIETIQASYYIKYKNSKFDETIVNSDADLAEIVCDDGLIFLSSFFPGISEDPEGKDDFKESIDFKDKDTPLKYPGMGLTILLNAAIDLLGGNISVRAENYFLNIKKPEEKMVKKTDSQTIKHNKYYEVKIEKRGEDVPFKGNMLTIRLPLKK